MHRKHYATKKSRLAQIHKNREEIERKERRDDKARNDRKTRKNSQEKEKRRKTVNKR